MYSTKENEAVLGGKRSLTDGSWDIPIKKKDNRRRKLWKTSTAQSHLHKSKNNYIKQNMRIEKQKKEKDLFRIFYGLNNVIDMNECEFLCNKN